MEPSLVEQGAMLMLIGMGTVFVFLSLLVMCMTLMSTAVMRLERRPGTGPGDEEVAAIAAAIAAYRDKNKPTN